MYLTIIGRGWAKYHDLSVASRSIICRNRRLRQIIDLQDTGKSWYFVITEFNNCFIIRSPRLSSYFNHFPTAQGSDLPFFSRKRCSNYAWAEYYLQQNTFRRYYAWANHCRQCRRQWVGSYLQVTWWTLGELKGRKTHLMITWDIYGTVYGIVLETWKVLLHSNIERDRFFQLLQPKVRNFYVQMLN